MFPEDTPNACFQKSRLGSEAGTVPSQEDSPHPFESLSE